MKLVLCISLGLLSGKGFAGQGGCFRLTRGLSTMHSWIQYSEASGKILIKPCSRISDFTEAKKIEKELWEKIGRGVGLSANQIGHSKQIFVIRFLNDGNPLRKGLEEVPPTVFVNPKITWASKERVYFWHKCLSALEKKHGQVANYKEIEYEAYDVDGRPFSGRLDGFGAIIFQHEFLHLMGKLYFQCTTKFIEEAELREQRDRAVPAITPCEDPMEPLLLEGYKIGSMIVGSNEDEDELLQE